MNTADYLLERGRLQDLALLLKESAVTYAELHRASARLAGELLARNIRPGQRVALIGENSLFWAAAYLAILKIGAVAVPFPTVATPEDICRKQEFARCACVCWDRKMASKLCGCFKTGLPRISAEVLEQPGPEWWEAPDQGFDPSREAALMFTSGTTGKPRLVRVTHKNIQANTESIVRYLELIPADRMLVILPFYYCFGTSLLHTHLRAGGSLALCNSFAFPETALNMLESAECTGFAGVPATFQMLLRNTSFPKRRFPRLRKVQQAGGKLAEVFIRELIAALPEAQIYIMYGQTEATARLSYLPPQLLGEKLGSIGKGIPGVELKVIDEFGFQVEAGVVGEIVARGDNISPGYLDEPEANAAKFIGEMLFTGDLATVDQDSYIYIVDRKSDFIKSSGHRISSQEIEEVILKLPPVISAAAIGVPDPILGEAILILAAVQPGSGLAAADILAYCQEHLARHMIPREIRIVDTLPVNANGKVVKSQLRSLINSAVPGD
jgi:acyl-CoA synthetase (AMP-forming)/AMP-acid ligase II